MYNSTPFKVFTKLIFMGWIWIFPSFLYSNVITVFKDNEIEEYVRYVSTPLLKAAGFDTNIVNFYLVDNPNPNAFVAGGQNVFVFSGLLNFINSDDELAGVIAHELSHITEGHLLQGTVLAQKSQAVILVSLLIGSIVAALNPAYLGAILATFTVAPTMSLYNSMLFYSRADEMQADKHAITILEQTPYSGKGLINFMERLKKLEGNPNYTMAWYSTHPLTTTRIQFLTGYLDKSTKKCCQASPPLLRVQAKLDAIELSYKSYINKHPPTNEINLYGLAVAELKEANYKKAEKILTQLLKNNATDKYYLELLADTYYSSNQFNLAYTTYLKINNHKDYIIDLKMAKCAYIIGTEEMIKKSLQYINISLSKNIYSPLGWHLKSLILSKLNKPYLAILAMAQKYWSLGDFNLANKYAYQAIKGINSNQPEWLEAQDLIEKTTYK